MFDQAMARIAGRFRRVEPRATARAFVLVLLSGVERKNCWQLAEEASHSRPGAMQRLLRNASWDTDEVRDDVDGSPPCSVSKASAMPGLLTASRKAAVARPSASCFSSSMASSAR